MRKTLLVLILIIYSNLAEAQVWGYSGASWHYDYGLITGGVITVDYTSDTVLNGFNSQVFSVASHLFYPQQNGTMVAGPVTN